MEIHTELDLPVTVHSQRYARFINTHFICYFIHGSVH